MEVGEYIRTKNGLIFKVRKIETSKIDIYWVNDEIYLLKEDIKSHSKDIIDLIEVGDYVNGCKVIGKYKENNEITLIVDTKYLKTKITNEDIKTILTHEIYEQNCYKVGVENE